jgi:hypothetical protein
MTSNGTRLVDGTLRKPLDWDQQIMPPPEQRISSPATLEGLAEPIAGPSGSDLTRRDRRWRMPEPQPVLDASETIQFNEARRLCHLPHDGTRSKCCTSHCCRRPSTCRTEGRKRIHFIFGTGNKGGLGRFAPICLLFAQDHATF